VVDFRRRRHLLYVGAPVSGKTMLAKRLPGILPPLQGQDALDVTMIHSAAGGRLPDTGCASLRSAPRTTAARW
jgi:predicted ATPase with chaperone activity